MNNEEPLMYHRLHIAVLTILLAVSLFVASPLFDFLLEVQMPTVVEPEFAKVTIDGNSVFSEVVRTNADLQKGLSGRPGLGPENGMLLVFQQYTNIPIWMKGMKFPIDIVWIAGNRVVNFQENVPYPATSTPDADLPIYYPDVPANLVLELPAGYVAQRNVRIGDPVSVLSQKELDETLEKKLVENRKEELRQLRFLTSKEGLTLKALRQRHYDGKNFIIVKTLSDNDAYTKYQISYLSDGLTISGVMNVPKKGKAPYPIIVLNHGYIDPELYTLGQGSRREQDYLARMGYVAIQSDYRGYGFSSPDPAARYDFNVGYTIDIMNLVEALKKLKSATLDTARIGMWGHSMGGGVTEHIMVLRNDIKAYVLFAPISSDLTDNIYLVQGKITDIGKDYGFTPETEQLLKDSSPFYALASVSAPVMINHGLKDTVVPVEFSRLLNKTLLQNHKTSLFYTYEGEYHEFIKAWPLAMVRTTNFFDLFVKNPKVQKTSSAKK